MRFDDILVRRPPGRLPALRIVEQRTFRFCLEKMLNEQSVLVHGSNTLSVSGLIRVLVHGSNTLSVSGLIRVLVHGSNTFSVSELIRVLVHGSNTLSVSELIRVLVHGSNF